jgi:hypothetical protein
MADETKGKANVSLGVVFIIWPLLALVESIRNYREPWAKNGIWLFAIFFGFTFVPRLGNDSMGYILRLQEFHNADVSFSQIIGAVYSDGSNYLDIIQTLITYLVSRVTGDYRILFAISGAIFGFFFSRNIWSLIMATEGKLGTIEKILLVLLALVIPLCYINGVRFWTAAHIFIYGAIQFLLYGRKQGILIASISVFMHFSFILPLGILGIYMLIGNRTTIYMILFAASLLISELNPLTVRDILLNFLPDILHPRVYSYTSENLIETFRYIYETNNWYVRWHEAAIKIAISILLFGVYFLGRAHWKEKKVVNLYSFSLLFAAVANSISSVSSLGRFVIVSYMFSIAGLFLFYVTASPTHATRKLFYLLMPVILFYFVVMIRTGFDNTGVLAIISNPIFAPLSVKQMALIDLIK